MGRWAMASRRRNESKRYAMMRFSHGCTSARREHAAASCNHHTTKRCGSVVALKLVSESNSTSIGMLLERSTALTPAP